MSKTATRIPLGELDPCGSRQAGRRSGLALTEDGPAVGLADGGVRAFDSKGAERWSVEGEGSAITIVPFDGGVLVGERSARGAVRFINDGEERWRHDAADVIGDPAKETRFFLPMVVDAAVSGDTAYVAARRYERQDGVSANEASGGSSDSSDGGRHFESSVYALAPDGSVRWRYDADASPISLAPFDEREAECSEASERASSAEQSSADSRAAKPRDDGDGGTASGVAVAYNRCPGDHDGGLVVLDGNGQERWTWDPEGDSEEMLRRVGDVSAADGRLFVTSHADYRGYRLSDGTVDWRVDLGTPRIEGDRVYAYPNHVHATESGVCFLTGNSFPEEGRETDERHPNEQSAFGYALDGDRVWRADTGGFSHEVATDGDRLLVPVAQHFRNRDHSVHGWHLFDVLEGPIDGGDCEGVVTAAAVDGERRALVEEPVRYHDDGTVLGEYALRRP